MVLQEIENVENKVGSTIYPPGENEIEVVSVVRLLDGESVWGVRLQGEQRSLLYFPGPAQIVPSSVGLRLL